MRPRSGQTALALVFVIGGIIVLLGTTLAFLTLSFLNSTYGFQASSRAAAAASGGIDDAMLQILRNKDFSNSGYCVPYSATLPCPTGSAYVTVTPDSPIPGQSTALSEATVSGYRRRLRAVFSVNATSSMVRLISSEQISI